MVHWYLPGVDQCASHLIHASLGLPKSTSKQHLHRFSRFPQLTVDSPYTLQSAAPFPLKITFSHGGSGSPANTWFLEPTQVHNPNSISIGSAVFAGLTTVTDRSTYKPYNSICDNTPHPHRTAIWPNKALISCKLVQATLIKLLLT